ncbi:MAG TPA: hypothetical protein VGR71_10855 [Nitrospira sp.]|nr:hypothetical protein [Nitrospira sp.]
MARSKTELGMGAGNVAWHDAIVSATGLTDEELDKEYAKYRSNGKERSDGGARGTFWSIGQRAYDPRKTHKPRKSRRKTNMSVFAAVARDPQVAQINADVLEPSLWRLLSRPEVTELELQTIITTTLRREGLYRMQKGDRELGMTFLRDKQPFRFGHPEMLLETYYQFSSWQSISGLTLIAAFSRESLRVGNFRHIDLLRDEFERCLMAVTYRYGFRKDLQVLIRWLAGFRIFSNRWDPDIPNDTTRAIALNTINAKRSGRGEKPLPSDKYNFWVEALAVRYHKTDTLHRYPPTALTPQLEWLDANRDRLNMACKAWDRGQPTDDLFSPLF